MEIWKDVIGYEGLYQVSSFGNVKSLSRERTTNGGLFVSKEKLLKAGTDCGYKKVVLTKNGVRSTKKVHRLVASAFLGDEPNLCVNHIDSNRSNNRVENLEWVTQLQNVRHARINNRYPKNILTENHKKILKDVNSKKVICTKTMNVYDSASCAALQLGMKRSTLIHYLIGSRKNKTTLKYL